MGRRGADDPPVGAPALPLRASRRPGAADVSRTYTVGRRRLGIHAAGAGGIGRQMASWIVDGEPELDLWKMDIRRFGAQYRDTLITSIDASQRPFVLHTDDGDDITADTIIVSTGASPRKLGVPGEEVLANRGVSYCATCDGFFFRGHDIAVAGGGDSALEEAAKIADACHRAPEKGCAGHFIASEIRALKSSTTSDGGVK